MLACYESSLAKLSLASLAVVPHGPAANFRPPPSTQNHSLVVCLALKEETVFLIPYIQTWPGLCMNKCMSKPYLTSLEPVFLGTENSYISKNENFLVQTLIIKNYVFRIAWVATLLIL